MIQLALSTILAITLYWQNPCPQANGRLSMASNQCVSPDDLIRDLKRHADPACAARAQQYHKSSRQHWGIGAPQLDAVLKLYYRQHPPETLCHLAQALWQTGNFDLMIAAARLLGQKQIPASDDLWAIVNTCLKDVDGWALEDQLAHAAWKCLLHAPSWLDEVEVWTEDDNLWMRRAALVYTLPYAKPGRDPERMLSWAAAYAPDPEWFIQKAIGWWLRELGKHNPPRVVDFLNAYWPWLRHVARKEATRRLHDGWLKQLDW